MLEQAAQQWAVSNGMKAAAGKQRGSRERAAGCQALSRGSAGGRHRARLKAAMAHLAQLVWAQKRCLQGALRWSLGRPSGRSRRRRGRARQAQAVVQQRLNLLAGSRGRGQRAAGGAAAGAVGAGARARTVRCWRATRTADTAAAGRGGGSGGGSSSGSRCLATLHLCRRGQQGGRPLHSCGAVHHSRLLAPGLVGEAVPVRAGRAPHARAAPGGVAGGAPRAARRLGLGRGAARLLGGGAPAATAAGPATIRSVGAGRCGASKHRGGSGCSGSANACKPWVVCHPPRPGAPLAAGGARPALLLAAQAQGCRGSGMGGVS